MKTFNKQLLSTSGLFVALLGLTSFNPFTQVNHLAAIDIEESITLASGNGRDGVRAGSTSDINDEGRIIDPASAVARNKEEAEAAAARAEDPKHAQADRPANMTGIVPAIARDGKPAPAPTTREAKPSTTAEGGVAECTTDECKKAKELEELLATLPADKRALVEARINTAAPTEDDKPEPSKDKCSDGDYRDRASCMLDAEDELPTSGNRGHGKNRSRRASRLDTKSQDYGNLLEEIEEFILEVATDEDLSVSDVNRIFSKLSRSKIVNSDRSLKADIAYAKKAVAARGQRDMMADRIEMASNYISDLDMQIQDAEQYGTYGNQRLDSLRAQRYGAVLQVQKEIAGFQQGYRMSLPAPKNNESALVSTLRDNMSADYTEMISGIAPALTDQRLATLDRASFSVPPSMNGNNYQNGVYAQNQTGPGQPPVGQGRPPYNPHDPNMVSGNSMNPQQQIQSGIMRASQPYQPFPNGFQPQRS